MKILITLLVLSLAVPCFAGIDINKVYVKADAVLEKEVKPVEFEVTQKMKDDVLKLKEITVQNIVVNVQGIGSGKEAQAVIDALLKDKSVMTKEDRYAVQFPSVEPETP